jgi:UPF0288 family protein (methanogenesis marker protein 3)
MLDLTTLNTRYFDIKLNKPGGAPMVLHLEPCKLKTLTKMLDVTKEAAQATGDNTGTVLESLVSVVYDILNKNKGRVRVSKETVEELSFDQLIQIITAYMEWLQDTKKTKN